MILKPGIEILVLFAKADVMPAMIERFREVQQIDNANQITHFADPLFIDFPSISSGTVSSRIFLKCSPTV